MSVYFLFMKAGFFCKVLGREPASSRPAGLFGQLPPLALKLDRKKKSKIEYKEIKQALYHWNV